MTPPAPPCPPTTADRVFDALWEEMADVIGTAATATLVRRSLRRATVAEPILGSIEVVRNGFDYAYTLPEPWHTQTCHEAHAALRALTRELVPLVTQLTGSVVNRRLAAVPLLRECGVFEERA